MSSFNVNLESLKFLMRKIDAPELRQDLDRIAHERGAVAIIAQAIADNFNLEGPGWPALKSQTIRRSVKGKTKKAVSDMTDKELLKHEARARREGARLQPFRKILQLTGLLKKTVTVPGFSGSAAKPSKKTPTPVSGSNVYRVEGHNIIWGTNLSYAPKHQEGDPKTKTPQRKFLVIRPEWQNKLEDWTMSQVLVYLRRHWSGIMNK